MIYYYSACGNSRHVAESLAQALGEQLAFIPEALRNGNTDFASHEGEPLGLVFPIYSWRVPQLVSDFIANLAIKSKPAYSYIVATYGDNAGIADKLFSRQLANKGLVLHAAYGIAMPNTYVNLSFMNIDTPELTQQKLAAAEPQIAAIAENIKRQAHLNTICRGSLPWFKSVVIGSLFNSITSDKAYHATDLCISCGRCAAVCPLHNITIDKPSPDAPAPRPAWHGQCNHCEACYHHCPTNAIQYGKATKGKGQYHYPAQGTIGHEHL